jgi:DNA-binding winged helix-turn-helix (wHTH) protein
MEELSRLLKLLKHYPEEVISHTEACWKEVLKRK